MEEYKSVGGIGNYYGGLWIGKKDGKFYWMIENYDSDTHNLSEWEEISERLYTALEMEDLNNG